MEILMRKIEDVLPGCEGEHILQKKYKTQKNAKRFYDREVYSYITDGMKEFIAKQTMLFIATSDKDGECDSSFRSAEKDFVVVLGKERLIYPEFNGNGVMASLGNISENGHIGMLFIDFFDTLTGLHINGKAKIVDKEELERELSSDEYEEALKSADTLEQEQVTWVVVDVEEAYIHCSKNIPNLMRGE